MRVFTDIIFLHYQEIKNKNNFLTKKFNIIKFNLKIKRQAIDVLSRRLNLSKRRKVNQTAGQTNIINNRATTKSFFFNLM